MVSKLLKTQSSDDPLGGLVTHGTLQAHSSSAMQPEQSLLASEQRRNRWSWARNQGNQGFFVGSSVISSIIFKVVFSWPNFFRCRLVSHSWLTQHKTTFTIWMHLAVMVGVDTTAGHSGLAWQRSNHWVEWYRAERSSLIPVNYTFGFWCIDPIDHNEDFMWKYEILWQNK